MTATTMDRFLKDASQTFRIKVSVAKRPAKSKVPVGSDIYAYLRDHILKYDPRSIEDPEQAWFWTAEWQAKEAEAERDIALGRGKVFETCAEFLADLDADD